MALRADEARRNRPPAAGDGRLQQILLSPEPGCGPLYRRLAGSTEAADATVVPPGRTLRLDTFVNSFYERYWRELAALETLEFRLATSGSCEVRIVRRFRDAPPCIAAQAILTGEDPVSALVVPPARQDGPGAVLHAEITALAETRIHGACWATNDAPRNEVSLAVAICSHSREAMLADTLRRLAPSAARNGAVGSVTVVHQGGRDLRDHPLIAGIEREDAYAGKLRLVRQANFGGSGGFARGMLEALDSGATHVLLLDDDIRIEPAMVDRLVALLRHLEKPATVGGQMLDLHRMTMLHASHETFDLRSLTLGNPFKGRDLSDPDCLADFSEVCRPGYNAWWFCCIPTATLRQVGLPAPFFIRHDDIEYGLRTGRSGLERIAMPGLFVWHEPFAAKLSPAYVYYERRNLLVTAAMHGAVRPRELAQWHLDEAQSALRVRRYDHCWALCRAARDFLSGPSAVFSDVVERHRRLGSEQARIVLLTMAAHREGTAGSAKIAELESSLVRDAAQAAAALERRSAEAASAYRAEWPDFVTPRYWRQLLGLEREET